MLTNTTKSKVTSLFQTDWFKAGAHCQANGMQLVSIETKAENDHLRLLQRSPELFNVAMWWTSGTDLGSEGNWRWAATGQSISQQAFKEWGIGQPSVLIPAFGPPENAMVAYGPHMSWWDWVEGAPNFSICEG